MGWAGKVGSWIGGGCWSLIDESRKKKNSPEEPCRLQPILAQGLKRRGHITPRSPKEARPHALVSLVCFVSPNLVNRLTRVSRAPTTALTAQNCQIAPFNGQSLILVGGYATVQVHIVGWPLASERAKSVTPCIPKYTYTI